VPAWGWTPLLPALISTAAVAEARRPLSFFAGPQCDRPAVEDGERFDSGCSVAPALGVRLGFAGFRRLQLEAEGQYSRRTFRSEAFVTDTSVRADFVELALLGAWPVVRSSGGLGVTAVLGPQVGILLGARRPFREVDQDVADELRPADLRIVFALRLSQRTRAGSVFIEGGLQWGLTDLDATNQQQIHSRALVVKLGLER
jgi:hypothetical protein